MLCRDSKRWKVKYFPFFFFFFLRQSTLAAVWKIKYGWVVKLSAERCVRWMLPKSWGEMMRRIQGHGGNVD